MGRDQVQYQVPLQGWLRKACARWLGRLLSSSWHKSLCHKWNTNHFCGLQAKNACLGFPALCCLERSPSTPARDSRRTTPSDQTTQVRTMDFPVRNAVSLTVRLGRRVISVYQIVTDLG